MRLSVLFSIVFLGVSPIALAAPAVTIGVSILPQKYFVERIAGSDANVLVMVGGGYNPVTYEPSPRQLGELNKASIYFLAGVPFENKWVKIFSKNNPSMSLVSMSKDISLRGFDNMPSADHVHGDANHHDDYDPHFWLNPSLVKIAAMTIRDTLVKNDPARVNIYQKNYLAFAEDLDDLDRYIRDKLLNTKHKTFSVFHPSWGYFADAYGLKQIAIQVQNKQSGARTLNETINSIRAADIRVIFVQKQFSETDAQMIARETGAKLVQVDPLAENYLENMKRVSKEFSEALQ